MCKYKISHKYGRNRGKPTHFHLALGAAHGMLQEELGELRYDTSESCTFQKRASERERESIDTDGCNGVCTCVCLCGKTAYELIRW